MGGVYISSAFADFERTRFKVEDSIPHVRITKEEGLKLRGQHIECFKVVEVKVARRFCISSF